MSKGGIRGVVCSASYGIYVGSLGGQARPLHRCRSHLTAGKTALMPGMVEDVRRHVVIR